MTAPLFFVAPGTLDTAAVGSALTLDGPEGRHAATVRRIGVGEPVLIADGTGLVASTTVVATRTDELVLTVTAIHHAGSAQPRLVLVQALTKDGRDLQAVESATELDVDRIVPWQADRSIVRWRGDRVGKAHAKWVATARAAAKQSRRPTVPDVAELVSGAGLVALVRDAALCLVLHESAEAPISAVALPTSGDVLIVVGPEGGIAPDELTALVEAGAEVCRLGPTVLRASTAGPAAIAALSARQRWQ